MKPLVIDLFCGLGGWAEGFLAEGYDVVGFDIERHRYPAIVKREDLKGHGGTWFGIQNNGDTYDQSIVNPCRGIVTTNGMMCEYPAQLVLQDVLTLDGAQFRNAACIVASPPCQKYSYMAMPWSLAKAQAAAIRADETGVMRRDLNALFDACFRIQREASAAAGRYIPMVVENVKGAQHWVGRAAWHYGSFYLWGDVPALMPSERVLKNSGGSWFGQRDGMALDRNDLRDMRRNSEGEWTAMGKSGDCNHLGKSLDGTKQGGDWFGKGEDMSISRRSSSRSTARKAASAQIAKIPFELARWIAAIYKPELERIA